jgi:hypothetical protein
MITGSTPYDGGANGSFKQDQVQNATGSFVIRNTPVSATIVFDGGVFSTTVVSSWPDVALTLGGNANVQQITFDLSRVARTGIETAPASISGNVYITY